MNDITDLRPTIIPKSDQLNSEQLLTEPLTITVTAVNRVSSEDQPLVIHYDNEQGRPYKPCKTMRKVLIAAWGKDGSQWIGKSMTLYCDHDVKRGSEKVGGIRISHLSHLPDGVGQIQLSLTVTRGKKATYTINRLQNAVDYASLINSAATIDALADAWRKIPDQQKQAFLQLKDDRKAALTNQQEKQ